MKHITLYSKKHCVQCDATKRYLDRKGIIYCLVDLTPAYDPKAAGTHECGVALLDLIVIKNLGHMQAPVVLVEVDGRSVSWSGMRPDLLAEYCAD